MSLKIIEQCQKACVSKKIDNKKTRRALERGNILLVNEVINDYNSKNIPKNRRNERFKIRDRLVKKLSEKNQAEMLIEPITEIPPEFLIEPEMLIRGFIDFQTEMRKLRAEHR